MTGRQARDSRRRRRYAHGGRESEPEGGVKRNSQAARRAARSSLKAVGSGAEARRGHAKERQPEGKAAPPRGGEADSAEGREGHDDDEGSRQWPQCRRRAARGRRTRQRRPENPTRRHEAAMAAVPKARGPRTKDAKRGVCREEGGEGTRGAQAPHGGGGGDVEPLSACRHCRLSLHRIIIIIGWEDM